MNSTICSVCSMTLSSLKMLKVHMKLHCSVCKKLFMSHGKLKDHTKTHSSVRMENTRNILCRHCKACNDVIALSLWTAHIRTTRHKRNSEQINVSHDLTKIRSDFNGRIEVYSFINKNEGILFPEEFFSNARNSVTKQLNECSRKHVTFKFNFELTCEYMKLVNDDMIVSPLVHISKMTLVTISDDVEELYRKHMNEITIKMDEFQERDSGWTLICIKYLEININKSSIIRGSYFIPLPKAIANKGACINIENDDIYCFKWCLVAALYQDDMLSVAQRKLHYSYNIENIRSERIVLAGLEINFEGLDFPLPLKQLKKFEVQNDISVNVFGHNESSLIGPYYVTSGEKQNHINLLLLNSNENFHYVYIKDISK